MIQDRIKKLKQEKNALILAHYYEDGAIQDIADFVGDSYQLSLYGQNSSHPIVLMAGVIFMAESVKMLSPDKIVLAPDLNAGCSLVEASPYPAYLKWRQEHPQGIAVTYINSSAQVKAISDVIVTSSNAQKIIESIPADRQILFGPDKNLGQYFKRTLNRDLLLWNGSCEVHVLFSARKLYEMIQAHPEAQVLAHPECEENVLQYAHTIGSTSRLLAEVTQSPHSHFIVATETGIFHQMQKARPDATIIQAPTEAETCGCNNCPYMKLNTLEKIEQALISLTPQISVNPLVAEYAKRPLDRMIQITQGKSVSWPTHFQLPPF